MSRALRGRLMALASFTLLCLATAILATTTPHFPTLDGAYEAERLNAVRITDSNHKAIVGRTAVVLLTKGGDAQVDIDADRAAMAHFTTFSHAFREHTMHMSGRDGVVTVGVLDVTRYPKAAARIQGSEDIHPSEYPLAVIKVKAKIRNRVSFKQAPEGAVQLAKLFAERLRQDIGPTPAAELASRHVELAARVFHKNASVALLDSTNHKAQAKARAECQGIAPGSQDSLDYVDFPGFTRKEFLCKYAFPGRPFVLRGAADSWPGIKKWSPQYFAKMFPNANFHQMDMGIEAWIETTSMSMPDFVEDVITAGKDDPAPPPWSVPYAGFSMGDVADQETGQRYHDVLKTDFETPAIFQENNWFTCFHKRCQQDMAIIFMGGKGTRQSNHQDHFSSSKWQTQFYGRKRWILHPPELSKALYYGRVDPFFPDLVQYPDYKEALTKRFDVVIEHGETIWWPAGWWHTTHALEDGIGLARNMLDEHNYQSFKVSLHLCRGTAADYPLGQGGSYCGCMKRNLPMFDSWYEKWLHSDIEERHMACDATRNNIGQAQVSTGESHDEV